VTYDIDSEPPGAALLTQRELEITRLVSQGLANKAVAGELGVQEGTVKLHLHNIYRKLRVSNRVELLLKAHAAATTLSSSYYRGPIADGAIQKI
jgi:DNA-binding NarL/FixJ family response regulator